MQKLGEYEIRGEIGRGGFGCVYMGFDPRVEKRVRVPDQFHLKFKLYAVRRE
jgi:hypothetical protein